jgi:hypothetical protein
VAELAADEDDVESLRDQQAGEGVAAVCQQSSMIAIPTDGRLAGKLAASREATDLPPTSLGRELVAVIQVRPEPTGARDEELQGGIGWHRIPCKSRRERRDSNPRPPA